MRSHPDDKQQASPTPPRKDFFGFFKSVVEFFTGVTGMATAALGILGTVAAFALAGSSPPAPGEGSDRGGTQTSPSVNVDTTVTPTTTPTSSARVDADDWAQAVNEECAGVVLIGGLGAAETGDLTTFSAAVGVLADELRAGPTPSGFEDEVASAADDFEQAATAAAAGDPDAAKRHADTASTTLRAVGVNGC